MSRVIAATIEDVDYSHGIIHAIDQQGNSIEAIWSGILYLSERQLNLKHWLFWDEDLARWRFIPNAPRLYCVK